ncbi:MAG TPA: DUF4142 domain-containing protein [Kofleriaceae bacterium]|nr:DUF4142 domain-containing protein [Kofleriaceae bacterium]
MKIKTLALAFALTTVPALASADDTNKTTDKTATDKAATDKTKAANKLVEAEVKIVAHLHHVNLMEIDMGKMAQKSGTAAVKRYGEMLVKDHTTADKELTAMAKKKGVAKIPADVPQTDSEKAEHKEQMDGMAALKKLKGADFDREYLRMMVDGHEKELAKSDPFIAQATDSDLKATLESRKTTLKRHADAARELQKGNAQASSATTPSGTK